MPLWHISEKLLDAFRHYLLQLTDLKVQTQETLMRLTICMHLHTNGETVNKALENLLANSFGFKLIMYVAWSKLRAPFASKSSWRCSCCVS